MKRYLVEVYIIIGQFMRDETRAVLRLLLFLLRLNLKSIKQPDDDDDNEVHIVRTASESDLGDLPPLNKCILLTSVRKLQGKLFYLRMKLPLSLSKPNFLEIIINHETLSWHMIISRKFS